MNNHILHTHTAAALLALLASAPLNGWAQSKGESGISVTGNVQSDFMIAPMQDAEIGTTEYDNDALLNNTYVDLLMQSRLVDAGIRLEYTQHPMPGFATFPNEDFKGWGLPNFWAKLKLKDTDVTLGSIYEQFGSGFVLRTYEERSLGIDNSLLGGRIVTRPLKGMQIKVLSGMQRNYWKWNSGLVSGIDVEQSIDQWFEPLSNNGTHLTFGASWVNKYEKNRDELGLYHDGVQYKVNAPEYVNALDLRLQLQQGGWNVLAEYATKSADPNSLNKAIFRRGYATMLSASYSKKGFSAMLQAKRSDNMVFRSKRADSHSTTSYINHLPAFTVDHTYALAALYPYATQPDGEWAYQASMGYNFKRKSTLGGKYGMKVKVNYSLVQSIDKHAHSGSALDLTDGYGSAFWKWGDQCYYQDLDVQVDRRLTKSFDMHLMYMYQQYNRMVEGHEGNIYSHIFVGEGKWKLAPKYTLRAEAQYLYTEHESDDWLFGLVELSIAPHLMLTVSDQIGRPEKSDSNATEEGSEYGDKTHYYTFAATGNWGNHRIQLSFGRTRAGMNCTGGVCRYIPASKGLTLNYNYNF